MGFPGTNLTWPGACEVSRAQVAVPSWESDWGQTLGSGWIRTVSLTPGIREPRSFPALSSLPAALFYEVVSIIHYHPPCVRYDMVVNVLEGIWERVLREVLV